MLVGYTSGSTPLQTANRKSARNGVSSMVRFHAITGCQQEVCGQCSELSGTLRDEAGGAGDLATQRIIPASGCKLSTALQEATPSGSGCLSCRGLIKGLEGQRFCCLRCRCRNSSTARGSGSGSPLPNLSNLVRPLVKRSQFGDQSLKMSREIKKD